MYLDLEGLSEPQPICQLPYAGGAGAAGRLSCSRKGSSSHVSVSGFVAVKAKVKAKLPWPLCLGLKGMSSLQRIYVFFLYMLAGCRPNLL